MSASDLGSPILRTLLELQPEAVISSHAEHGDLSVEVRPDALLPVMRCLQQSAGLDFEMLMDLTCVDHLGGPQPEPRFEMVYHLYSVSRNHRLRVKTRLAPAEPPRIDSCCALWASAEWMEREVYDLYGVRFRDHPDLRRILLYDEFEGHPLRKDYRKDASQPLIGPRSRS